MPPAPVQPQQRCRPRTGRTHSSTASRVEADGRHHHRSAWVEVGAHCTRGSYSTLWQAKKSWDSPERAARPNIGGIASVTPTQNGNPHLPTLRVQIRASTWAFGCSTSGRAYQRLHHSTPTAADAATHRTRQPSPPEDATCQRSSGTGSGTHSVPPWHRPLPHILRCWSVDQVELVAASAERMPPSVPRDHLSSSACHRIWCCRGIRNRSATNRRPECRTPSENRAPARARLRSANAENP